jgi:hypothetical protein
MIVVAHSIYRHHVSTFPKSVQLSVLYDLANDALQLLVALSGYVEWVGRGHHRISNSTLGFRGFKSLDVLRMVAESLLLDLGNSLKLFAKNIRKIANAKQYTQLNKRLWIILLNK